MKSVFTRNLLLSCFYHFSTRRQSVPRFVPSTMFVCSSERARRVPRNSTLSLEASLWAPGIHSYWPVFRSCRVMPGSDQPQDPMLHLWPQISQSWVILWCPSPWSSAQHWSRTKVHAVMRWTHGLKLSQPATYDASWNRSLVEWGYFSSPALDLFPRLCPQTHLGMGPLGSSWCYVSPT